MNEKGETTLFAILFLVVLTGLLTLCGLELEQSFRRMQNRTEIFLCVKEINGEIGRYMKFMGRSNWAIKHTNRTRLIMLVIPGLQGTSLQADKLKKALKHLQDATLVAYLKKLADLKKVGCPLDPRLALTPFQLDGLGYQRDKEEVAVLRNKEWTWHYLKTPYLISVTYDAQRVERLNPDFSHTSKEKGAMLSSLLSSPSLPAW